MRLLEANPRLSQRELSRELGISLGKVNYCVRALMQVGWIKATNFKNSQNKAAYMYLLTPRGVEQKAQIAVSFLKRKIEEYEVLRVEIEQLRVEAKQYSADAASRMRRPASAQRKSNNNGGTP